MLKMQQSSEGMAGLMSCGAQGATYCSEGARGWCLVMMLKMQHSAQRGWRGWCLAILKGRRSVQRGSLGWPSKMQHIVQRGWRGWCLKVQRIVQRGWGGWCLAMVKMQHSVQRGCQGYCLVTLKMQHSVQRGWRGWCLVMLKVQRIIQRGYADLMSCDAEYVTLLFRKFWLIRTFKLLSRTFCLWVASQLALESRRGFGCWIGHFGFLNRSCWLLMRVFLIVEAVDDPYSFYSFHSRHSLGFLASRLVRWLLGFSACLVASRLLGFSASRLLGLPGGSSAPRLAWWLLGLSGGFSASRLPGFWSHFRAPFTRALNKNYI